MSCGEKERGYGKNPPFVEKKSKTLRKKIYIPMGHWDERAGSGPGTALWRGGLTGEGSWRKGRATAQGVQRSEMPYPTRPFLFSDAALSSSASHTPAHQHRDSASPFFRAPNQVCCFRRKLFKGWPDWPGSWCARVVTRRGPGQGPGHCSARLQVVACVLRAAGGQLPRGERGPAHHSPLELQCHNLPGGSLGPPLPNAALSEILCNTVI